MKKIAPIIITMMCSCYLLFVFIGILNTSGGEGNFIFIVLSISLLSLLVALIYTLIKRLIEIDKENDDDISKYWLYFR